MVVVPTVQRLPSSYSFYSSVIATLGISTTVSGGSMVALH